MQFLRASERHHHNKRALTQAQTWLCGLLTPAQQSRLLFGGCSSSASSPESSRFYDSSVEKFACLDVEVLSLSQMLRFGRHAVYDRGLILKSARMIQRELPKRLARRLMDLQFLPHIVVTNPHIKRVYDAYYHAFTMLRDMPPVNSFEQNTELSSMLRRLLDEHAPMLDALAAGLRECRSKPLVGDKLRLDAFLDGMLRSRISRRVLAEQHLQLGQARQGFVGVICTDLRLSDALDHAIQQARQVCTETYGTAPPVAITGSEQATLSYIPNHLDYTLFEVLKNAMRAVVEAHSSRSNLPAIHIRVADAESCVTLRISDQGGGIADEHQAWLYGFTTVPVRGSAQAADAMERSSYAPAMMTHPGSPMAGLGFGLPLSRLHARYFGGDLQLVSMPGHGTDAYLTVQHLEGPWEEPEAEDLVAVSTADASWSSGMSAAQCDE